MSHAHTQYTNELELVTVTVLYSKGCFNPQKWVTPTGPILPPSLPDCPLQREDNSSVPLSWISPVLLRVPAPYLQTAQGQERGAGKHEQRDSLEKQLLLMSSSGITAAGSWWELVVELKAVTFQRLVGLQVI